MPKEDRNPTQPEYVGIRKELGLKEYRGTYLYQVFSHEEQAQIEEIKAKLVLIMSGEWTFSDIGPYVDMLSAVKPSEEIPLKLRLLDGAGFYENRTGDNFADQVRIRVHTLFNKEETDEELKKLVQKAKDNSLRVTLVTAHGGTISKWDPTHPLVSDTRWMYWDSDNRPKPVQYLLETLANDSDVVLMVCCNETEIEITESPVLVYYNLGIQSLMAEAVGAKADMRFCMPNNQGEYKEKSSS